MNTPRQPNARPGAAPFLGQSHNAAAPQARPYSFVTPVLPESTPEATGIAGNVTSDTSKNDPARGVP